MANPLFTWLKRESQTVSRHDLELGMTPRKGIFQKFIAVGDAVSASRRWPWKGSSCLRRFGKRFMRHEMRHENPRSHKVYLTERLLP